MGAQKMEKIAWFHNMLSHSGLRFFYVFLKVDTFRVLSRLGINGVANDA